MTEITANYDETWKEVIGDYFDSFLAFFYPEINQEIDWTKTPISLDKELEQITATAESKTRHADKLFQVWLLARLLYERGYNRKEIVDLYKVIDLMMALSGDLQLSFEEKLTNYQEKLKMPLLTNIEQRTIEKTTKQTRKQDIIKLLQVRFGDLPENLVASINKIDDTSFLEQLLISTINVSSLEEFAQLVNSHLPAAD